jgi:hypothetical protein
VSQIKKYKNISFEKSGPGCICHGDWRPTDQNSAQQRLAGFSKKARIHFYYSRSRIFKKDFLLTGNTEDVHKIK